MGFSHVDVCYAFRGWHARSFANSFPRARGTGLRVCGSLLCLTLVDAPATLMVMALQPTKRGAWCRSDRRKSYRLGDVSVLIARLSADGSAVEEVVGGGLRGADRGEGMWASRLDQPGATYVIIPLCLGNNPVAAESTQVSARTLNHLRSISCALVPLLPVPITQRIARQSWSPLLLSAANSPPSSSCVA